MRCPQLISSPAIKRNSTANSKYQNDAPGSGSGGARSGRFAQAHEQSAKKRCGEQKADRPGGFRPAVFFAELVKSIGEKQQIDGNECDGAQEAAPQAAFPLNGFSVHDHSAG